jgi:4-hydroxythreonine-4-phosphate dehydrogenase
MNIRTPIRETSPGKTHRNEKPRIAVSMGDAGGIGPEVALKALSRIGIRQVCEPVLVGDLSYLRTLARSLRIGVSLRKHSDSRKAHHDGISVLEVGRMSRRAPVGKASRTGGIAALRALEEAVKLALSGGVDGIVTAPASKESFALAGCGPVGHTELLARLTRTRAFAMMLMSGKLRVVFATTHVPLRRAARTVTSKGLVTKLRLTHKYLDLYMGIRDARIGVAAVNPHCGEGGHIGREEVLVIEPAIKAARIEGIAADGPYPADSIFRPAFARRFDAVIAMYHDQGMIPLKLRGHGEVVNITLGIPILRVSPGHGTAFDIAGRGIAGDRSMVKAIQTCARIAKRLKNVG